MNIYKDAIVLVACVLVSSILWGSCSKEFDADRYVGKYRFSTSGELHAYMVQNTDGATHPTGNNKSFIVRPISGTAKIFRSSNESRNNLRILATYDNGEVIQIEAVVNKANGIEVLPFSRKVQLLDGRGENTVYDGLLSFKGDGNIVDGVICINLNPQSTFKVDSVDYGFSSSDILVVADKDAL